MNLIDESIFSLSHVKATSDGSAGHEEVDDIDHTSFNIKKINNVDSTSLMIMNMMAGSKP